MHLILCFLILLSCGRNSGSNEELLEIVSYESKKFEIVFLPQEGFKTTFKGEVIIEGAGLHLKLLSKFKEQLFIELRNQKCEFDSRSLWSLNNEFGQQTENSQGLVFKNGILRKSFNYYLLLRFLKSPKKKMAYLRREEAIDLDHRSFYFYRLRDEIHPDSEYEFMGCANIYST